MKIIEKKIRMIKASGTASRKEYLTYLQELEVDELKEIRHNLDIKIHRVSGVAGGLFQAIRGIGILVTGHWVFKCIQTLLLAYIKANQEDAPRILKDVKGVSSIGFTIIFVLVLVLILHFIAYSYSLNKAKKKIVEEIISEKEGVS